VPSPKTPSRKSSRPITGKGRQASQPGNPVPALQLAALSDEWWSSWRRANAIGWVYLNAVSGLFRLPFTRLASTRFTSPFQSPFLLP
jgi:hypothetical protein